MTKKYSVIKTGSIVAAVFVFMLASEARAFFYRPAAALNILSEYVAVEDSAPPRFRTWKVVPESGADGALILRFYPKTATEEAAVCELAFLPLGAGGEIRWRGMGKSTEKNSETGLLLAPGFPAPCDVLPVGEKDESVVYQEKSEAGGSVFVRNYLVSAETISVAEAKARGWIREDAQAVVTGLILVTATDDRGQLAVRQLWPVDGSWWLYEETLLRRSWLTN